MKVSLRQDLKLSEKTAIMVALNDCREAIASNSILLHPGSKAGEYNLEIIQALTKYASFICGSPSPWPHNGSQGTKEAPDWPIIHSDNDA